MNTLEEIDRTKSYAIPGYDGYRITPDGKVFSDRVSALKNRELKGWHNRKGYKIVGLMINGKLKSIPIHKLQELTFLGGPKEGLQIDHIDGDKNNNDVTNLRQVTPKENINNPVTLEVRDRVIHSEEFRKKHRASMEKLWNDPVFHQKLVDAAKARANDPKWIVSHARAMKEMYQRPEIKRHVYENLKKMNEDPEMRKYNAERSREVNSRKCRATHPNGQTIIFDSVTACANYFGVNPSLSRRTIYQPDGLEIFNLI